MFKIRGDLAARRVAPLLAAVLAIPFLPAQSSAQAPPQMRQSVDFTQTAVSSVTPQRVALMDTTGFQSYEFAVSAFIPSATNDFGTFTAVFYESNPDLGNPIGDVFVPFRFEVDAGFQAQGPIRGPFMELLYLAPASNVSPIEADVDLVNRAVELDRARDESGVPLDWSFLNVGAGATTAYAHGVMASGPATLVLGAPSRKGTFRVQLGGLDVEDVPVPAGVTLRLPYTLPLRSMSVRVTNTDIAAGSYSARLVASAA